MNALIRGVSSETTTIYSRVDRSITPDDTRQVGRLVGYTEYTNALANLDALVSKASAEELKAFDELLRERDEFVVYTNLSQRVEPKRSAVSELRIGDDDFARRGLKWVTALARVELGSMLAAFTSVRRPYQATHPTKLDQAEFAKLLMDGVRTHYWALSQDPALREVAKASPRNPEVLSYHRRMTMVRALLQMYGSEITHAQRALLSQWRDTIDGLQLGFAYRIYQYLQQTEQGRQTTTAQSEIHYRTYCSSALACYARYQGSAGPTTGR